MFPTRPAPLTGLGWLFMEGRGNRGPVAVEQLSVEGSFRSSLWRAVKSAAGQRMALGPSEGHFGLEDQDLLWGNCPVSGKCLIKSSSRPSRKKNLPS